MLLYFTTFYYILLEDSKMPKYLGEVHRSASRLAPRGAESTKQDVETPVKYSRI